MGAVVIRHQHTAVCPSGAASYTPENLLEALLTHCVGMVGMVGMDVVGVDMVGTRGEWYVGNERGMVCWKREGNGMLEMRLMYVMIHMRYACAVLMHVLYKHHSPLYKHHSLPGCCSLCHAYIIQQVTHSSLWCGNDT